MTRVFVPLALLVACLALAKATSFDKYDPGVGVYPDGHGDQPLTDKEYIKFIRYYPTGGVYLGKLDRRGPVVFYRPLLVAPNRLPLVYVHTPLSVKKTHGRKESPDSAPASRY